MAPGDIVRTCFSPHWGWERGSSRSPYFFIWGLEIRILVYSVMRSYKTNIIAIVIVIVIIIKDIIL